MRAIVLCLALACLVTAGLDPAARVWAGEEDPAATATAAECYRDALRLQAEGDEAAAGEMFARVIALEPGHAAARRALGYEKLDGRWQRGDDLYRAKGFLHYDGRWMTAQEFAAATRPQRELAEQTAGEERVLGLLAGIASEAPDRVQAARRRLAVEDARFKLAPLAKALRCRPTSLRLYAAEELGRLGNPLAVPALLRRAIEDTEADVRRAAAVALRAIGEPSAVHPLGRALDSRYATVRVRAAEALLELGDEVGMPYVIHKWELRSGDFPRAYFTTVRQISYIQDFDVEVAQTSFIADPIVGVLQEGAVQDVKVLATEITFSTVEAVAYENALRGLSGQDHGRDVGAWRRWWQENELPLLEQRAQRIERRAAEGN